MQARQNANGQYVRDVEATKKIQGSQFIKIIKGIAESKLYGYTLIEINPTTDPITGKLNDVNLIERRNVLPEQKTVLKRQGIWLPNWDLEAPKYKKNYILVFFNGFQNIFQSFFKIAPVFGKTIERYSGNH